MCAPRLSPSTSAALLQDILHMDSAQKATDEAAECGLSCPTDIDKRVVDLLLGRYILFIHFYNLKSFF